MKASRPQQRDGFECQNAVGAPAIDENLAVHRQARKPGIEFGRRHIDRTGYMPRFELVARADVEDQDTVVTQAAFQLRARHRLEGVKLTEAGRHDFANFGDISFGDTPETPPNLDQAGSTLLLRAQVQFPSLYGIAHLVHISMPLIDRDDPACRSRNMIQELLGYMNGNAERGKIGRACTPEIV